MKPVKNIISMLIIMALQTPVATAEIVINEDNSIPTSSATVFKIDDDVVSETEFEQQSDGQIATVSVDDSSTAAAEVNADNTVKGPVTSLDPFQVFGQDVVIDAATVLANNNGTFSLGDLLEVSGSFDTSNVILATRVERKASLLIWKLHGHVEMVAGAELSLGLTTFDTTGIVLEDCGATISVGDLIEVKTNPIPNFTTAMTVTDITKFECKNGLVDLPNNPGANLQFEVEGFVSEIIDADNFKLNGQQVSVSASTTYFNGTQSDIVEGVKLEAEGTLDTATNILSAAKIKFKNTKVRLEGPVSSMNLDADQVTILGITGVITAFTEDKDNLLATGLANSINIEARGYVDSAGTFFVEEFRDRGNADATDTRLRGPVANLNQPAFTILGVNVDTANAQFFIEGQATDSANFYATLTNNSIVDINHGSFDAETNTIAGGEVTIELPDDSSASASINKATATGSKVASVAAINSVSYGTVTGFTAAQAPAPVPNPAPTPAPSSGGGGGTGIIFLMLLGLGLIKRKA